MTAASLRFLPAYITPSWGTTVAGCEINQRHGLLQVAGFVKQSDSDDTQVEGLVPEPSLSKRLYRGCVTLKQAASAHQYSPPASVQWRFSDNAVPRANTLSSKRLSKSSLTVANHWS